MTKYPIWFAGRCRLDRVVSHPMAKEHSVNSAFISVLSKYLKE